MIIDKLIKKAKLKYEEDLVSIEESSELYRSVEYFKLKLAAKFPQCSLEAFYIDGHATVRIYLEPGLNISRDIALFLEKEEELINKIANGEEIDSKDYNNQSYDINIGNLRFEVYYHKGSCKKVKIGEKEVTEDIYEIICE